MRKLLFVVMLGLVTIGVRGQNNSSVIEVEGDGNEIRLEQSGQDSKGMIMVDGIGGYYLLNQAGDALLLNIRSGGMHNIVHTEQLGYGSRIDISQYSVYDKVFVYQDGQGHYAGVSQQNGGFLGDGYNKAYIYQDGAFQSAWVNQSGYNNWARIYQDMPKVQGFNQAEIIQAGDDNEALIKQSESYNIAKVSQEGWLNWVEVDQVSPGGQDDSFNEAYIKQEGFDGWAYVYQDGYKNYLSLKQWSDNADIEIIQKGSKNPDGGHTAVIDLSSEWGIYSVSQISGWSDYINVSLDGENGYGDIRQENGILPFKTAPNTIVGQFGGRDSGVRIVQGGENNSIRFQYGGLMAGLSIDQLTALRNNQAIVTGSSLYSSVGIKQVDAAEENMAEVNQNSGLFTYAHITQSGYQNHALIQQKSGNEYASAVILQGGTNNQAWICQAGQLSDVIGSEAYIRQGNDVQGSGAVIEQYVGGADMDARIEQYQATNVSALIQQEAGVAFRATINQYGMNNTGTIVQSGTGSALVANIAQGGSDNAAKILQSGTGNNATIIQNY